jgi:hypothetical protein
MVELLFGVSWIICLVGLLIGDFRIEKDTYDEANQSAKESVETIGGTLQLLFNRWEMLRLQGLI